MDIAKFQKEIRDFRDNEPMSAEIYDFLDHILDGIEEIANPRDGIIELVLRHDPESKSETILRPWPLHWIPKRGDSLFSQTRTYKVVGTIYMIDEERIRIYAHENATVFPARDP